MDYHHHAKGWWGSRRLPDGKREGRGEGYNNRRKRSLIHFCCSNCFRLQGAERLIQIWSTRTPLAGPTERQRHGLFRFVYIGLIAIGGILVIQAAVR